MTWQVVSGRVLEYLHLVVTPEGSDVWHTVYNVPLVVGERWIRTASIEQVIASLASGYYNV